MLIQAIFIFLKVAVKLQRPGELWIFWQEVIGTNFLPKGERDCKVKHKIKILTSTCQLLTIVFEL